MTKNYPKIYEKLYFLSCFPFFKFSGSPATHPTLYHQGDCDEHDQCAVGLHCGVDNCQGDETGEADCCKPKSCVLGDPWKTRPDWDCCRSLNDHQFSLLLTHHLALFKINPFSLVTSTFSCCYTTKLTNDWTFVLVRTLPAQREKVIARWTLTAREVFVAATTTVGTMIPLG